MNAKRFFAHRVLAVDKARGLAVVEFRAGVVRFRLPEEGAAGEAEAPTAPAAARGKGTAEVGRLTAFCTSSSTGGPSIGPPIVRYHLDGAFSLAAPMRTLAGLLET